jgi:choice-of-anchor C domain-containing protein
MVVAVGAALAGAFLLASAASAATVTNGGFETGPTPDPALGGYIEVPTHGTIDGWTVNSGTVDYIGSYWQPSEGQYSIDLDGTSQGSISQTFATKFGSTYVVQFDLSGNPDNFAPGEPTMKTLEVSATGTPAATFTYDVATKGNTRDAMKWDTDQAYSFMATGPSTTLTFSSKTGTFYGAALDNIRVTETLLTGANCKKDGWKTMQDYLGHSFKNQGDCVSFYATDGRNLAAGS